jgi:hypothetical protein
MNFENIKQKILQLTNLDHSHKTKIYTSISLGWIILVGYLTWWNGIKGLALDKSFKWDEWFWFGVIPALAPYLFYFIWRKKKSASNKVNYFKK